ncbi:hypothetical protein NIA70_19445 [[Clostridium] scindens]|uniref:hypothetical protein n=1 Tax=Clostridium scindens (strain JCM 10418 / VPI 12708) TaxID=29347 RepID=UPI0020973DBB|nr:hypothetical protein [[Clostridium] scindens]MCO7174329.1 hypothetical protein [[Clostridium] scindens]
MPALKVSDKEMKNRILLGSLENRMKIMGFDKKGMAQRIGMPYSTFCLRLRNPGKFNLEELQALFSALKMPDSEKEKLGKEVM